MHWLPEESNSLHQSGVCYRQIRPSTSQWWCPWVCPSWGEWSGIAWMLSVPEWRSMTNTAVKCFWLKTKLMPVMREICGDFFIFQQGNVLAHRACDATDLLKRDLRSFHQTFCNPTAQTCTRLTKNMLHNTCQNSSGAVTTPGFGPTSGNFVVSRTRLHLSDKAFSIAGPRAWNALPSDIKLISTGTASARSCTSFLHTFLVSSSLDLYQFF